MIKKGSGKVTLTGNGSYTGNRAISFGVLEGTLANIKGNIVNNGTVLLSNSSGGIYSDVLFGHGPFCTISYSLRRLHCQQHILRLDASG